MLNFFNGTATAMITPFGKDGKVNFDAFGRMIEFQIENGTDALVILGTTGEPATMTEAEKEEVMRFSVEKIAHRAKIVFGSGSNCTAHAVEASKKAEAFGADGLLAMRHRGAYTIGQDKESSVVYGMPGVANDIGAVITQASCDNIAGVLLRHLKTLSH